MQIFNNETIPLMKSALKAYNLRQTALANNIANATTPGYQRKEVVFEETLQNAVDKLTTNVHEHVFVDGDAVQPELVNDPHTALINGVNNVDIDKEMAFEAENALKYQAVVQALIQKYRIVNDAIRGR